MTQPDTVPVYSALQRRLHALVAVLLLVQYLTGDRVREAMARVDAVSAIGVVDFLATTAHSLAGLAIGGGMWWRWRLRRARDVPVARACLGPSLSRWIRLHHRSMYVLVAVLVGSGALHYYAEFPGARACHELAGWMLLLALFLHVGGTVWHSVVRRDGVLAAMFGRR